MAMWNPWRGCKKCSDHTCSGGCDTVRTIYIKICFGLFTHYLSAFPLLYIEQLQNGKEITDTHRRMYYDYWSIISAWKN